MKRKQFLLVLLAAVTFGTLAGVFAIQYLRLAGRPAAAQAAPEGKLVVARRDLPLGALVAREDVLLIDWPARTLPSGYAAQVDDVVGRGLITPVYANEPLLTSKMSTPEEGGGLPIVIPRGMRGVSVKVDQVVGVAGFVLPGTTVDVLMTIKPPKEGGDSGIPATKLILQNVRVLAAGQTIERDAEGKPQVVSVVTLLVSPDEGEKLVLAANEGRIQLALRNTLDLDSVTTLGIRTSALLTSPAPRPVARSIRSVPSTGRSSSGAVVETFRGGERTLQTFSPRQP